MDSDICQVTIVDRQRIASAENQLPDPPVLAEVAATFKLLGDPTRLKILHALAAEELCVCDLAALLAVSISAVSHQLRLLRGQGVVRFRREGKIVYYQLDDDHIRQVMADMRAHIESCRR
ncbi:ArsR/SmtB family transcription factor [Geothermobacter hydrogeniphilus]|uniref:Transcriptional regulator n=1 Tax=Geothermobacter hydrogeniphilus TaxID=1969733 RepID=A0A1X0Y643_9BACT|nr:metalloregulator ArsR/SmtB family transcription factor [Geothermobacter hydrogeniphilus]ORJ60606.1 transcriptional regulator [Geothermobacter hydrogeniphilus]